MLVLTRKRSTKDKPQPGVLIDGPCYISIVEIRGNTVRLGFISGKDTDIVREELLTVDQLHDFHECLTHNQPFHTTNTPQPIAS